MEERVTTANRLCATVRRLHERGWCGGTGGNFSAVLSDDPVRLLITRSGCDKGELAPDDLIVIDGAGASAGHDDGRPSAEALVHCAIVAATSARSVLHTHSIPATLLGERFLRRRGFTISGYEMLKGLEGIVSHEAEVVVPVVPNTQDMAALSVTVTGLIADQPELRGFLIAGHGLYTWGRSVPEARRHVEIYEFLFDCLARRTKLDAYEG